MSEIGIASIDVQLIMVKHTRFLELTFILKGWAEVDCDRCLYPVNLDIASKSQMYVKFDSHVDDENSEENDVIVLSNDEDLLDVAQYLYEYAHLSLPIRRVHPDDTDGQSTCNQEMLLKLKQYLVKENLEQDS